MSVLVPNRFLFSFEFPLVHRAEPPTINGLLADWTDRERLPDFGRLDRATPFADVWACWNESGIFFACRVEGKRRPLRCQPRSFWKGDNIRLCTDMRDARANKRATRFCRQFFLLPTGGGRARTQPMAGVNPIQRAREPAPAISVQRVRIASVVTSTGYGLETHIPGECLYRFDPESHPRIGFYYIVEDSEFGQQFLTVGDDLNWHIDPSTWATAVLVR